MSVPIFVEFRASMSDFVAKMGVANAEIDKLSAKGAGMGAKMAIGGAAAATGVAALGVTVAAVSLKMAGDFQQATNVLVTAAGESTKNIGMIRDGILKISTDTATSWQEVTAGAYTLEKAGYRAADTLLILKSASQGAREEGASLAVVTQAMTSIMASYHLKASDAVMVMNRMKTAAGESKTTMEEFAGSLSTVLPLASANKISFADVGGSLASLTQHGTSADEATQELANTIRNLSAPNMVAVKEMQQLGISSQDVSLKMGDGPGGRGLAGTLNYLSRTVLEQMGPSGKVLLDTFNRAGAASKDATDMLSKMAPATATVARAFQSGSITMKTWSGDIKAMPTDQANLARQFAVMENRADGFNIAIRNGLPGTQTYTEAIKKMTGGANGLNTLLQLTGESMAATDARIKAIADTTQTADGNTNGWDITVKSLNVRMGQWANAINTAAIKLGEFLIPYVVSAMDWLQNKLIPTVRTLAADALPYLEKAFGTISASIENNRASLQKLWSGLQDIWNMMSGPAGKAALQFIIANLAIMVGSIDAVIYVIGALMDPIGTAQRAFNSLSRTIQSTFDSLVSSVKAAIGDAPSMLYNIGQQIINGLINGITSKISDLGSTLSKLATGIPGSVGHLLGISSPSKVMADLGQWIPAGLAQGIDNGSNHVANAMARMSGLASGGAAGQVSYGLSGSGFAGTAGRPVASLGAGAPVTVNIDLRGAVVTGGVDVLADQIRSSLLGKKSSGQVTTLGLS